MGMRRKHKAIEMPSHIVDARFTVNYYDDPSTWRTTYWLGVQTAKCPLDLWIFQEILIDILPILGKSRTQL